MKLESHFFEVCVPVPASMTNTKYAHNKGVLIK